MRFFKRQVPVLCLTVLLVLINLPAWSQGTPDATRNVDTKAFSSANSGHMQLGVGYLFEEGPFTEKKNGMRFFFSGRYQWERFFVEAHTGSSSGDSSSPAIGYSLLENDHWVYDAYLGTTLNFLSVSGIENNKLTRSERKHGFHMGVRASGLYGDNQFQFALFPVKVSPVDNPGIFASASYAREWQIRNLIFHLVLGAKYRGYDISYYANGPDGSILKVIVDGSHLTAAEKGVDLNVQIGFSYPLTKHLALESYLRYTEVTGSEKDIEIFAPGSERPDSQREAGILLNYNF